MIFEQAPALAVALAGMEPFEGGLYYRPADGWLYRWVPQPSGLGDLGGFFSKVKKAVKKVGKAISKGAKSVGKAVKKGVETAREVLPALAPIAAAALAPVTGGTSLAFLPAALPLVAGIMAKDPKVPKEKAQQMAQGYLDSGQVPADLLPYMQPAAPPEPQVVYMPAPQAPAAEPAGAGLALPIAIAALGVALLLGGRSR